MFRALERWILVPAVLLLVPAFAAADDSATLRDEVASPTKVGLSHALTRPDERPRPEGFASDTETTADIFRPRSKTRAPSLRPPAVHPVTTDYVGPELLRAQLQSATTRPIALTADDFDEDGVPDLVSGYVTTKGGLVTLHRGNVDAIYPNSPGAQQRKLEGTFTDEPFLSTARIFELPGAPDFLVAGDFDNDGHRDIVAAARGGQSVFLLPGDGQGGVGPVRLVALEGNVTTMASGEINRMDGLADLVVGLSGPTGHAVLVFEGPNGALEREPEVIPVPDAPMALALGQLDEEPLVDLAVAASNNVLIVHGRDRRLSLDEKRRARVGTPVMNVAASLESPIGAMAIGDYVWDGRPGRELALLDTDGRLHLLGRADDDPAAWKSIDERPLLAGAIASPMLMTARVFGLPLQELVVLDEHGESLHFVFGEVSGSLGDSLSVALDAPPVAALSMRLNRDALGDLVLLRKGAIVPVVIPSSPTAVITVDSTLDPPAANGLCELAEAIDNANANSAVHADCPAGSGADLIAFAIAPMGSVATIATGAASLPALTDSGDTIDGGTQGCATPPCIELNGGFPPPSTPDGLTIHGSSVTARGLYFRNFTDEGIVIDGSDDNIVEGNSIRGSGSAGVRVTASSFNLIGGTAAPARNFIVGNNLGIAIQADENRVEGNFIGIDTSGSALGNFLDGVSVLGGDANVIGGTAAGAGNLISANGEVGVEFVVIGMDIPESNLVQGNLIGTDAAGTAALGNGSEGVLIEGQGTLNTIGGTAVGAGNVMSANGLSGIEIRNVGTDPGPSENLIQQNLIGTDVSGLVGMGNVNHGISIFDSPSNTVGGAVPGAGNIISGNDEDGVTITDFDTPGNSESNVIQGNIIGLDATGTVAMGNGGTGVWFSDASLCTIGGATPDARNVISGNLSFGVVIVRLDFPPENTSDNVVQGNYIGTDASGTVAHGNEFSGVIVQNAPENTIGGPSPGEGNLISANGEAGLFIAGGSATGNVVQGNLIGTDVGGISPLPNGVIIPSGGILVGGSPGNTIGGPSPGEGNLVSGNAESGVSIQQNADGNVVQGNFIGTDISGTFSVPNDVDGVEIQDSSGNTIGGAGAGEGNVIAFNSHGVLVRETSSQAIGNDILSNSIHTNDLLGISLAEDGVTPNDVGDPDTGPNHFQNFPVVTATQVGSGTYIDGTLNSTASTTFRLEFFSSSACDPAGFGEGEGYLGSTNVTTDGGGDAIYSVAVPPSVPVGTPITATATGPDGTSEFSECVGTVACTVVVFPQTVFAQDEDSLAWAAAEDINAVRGPLSDVANYTTTGDPTTLTGATSLDISTDSPGPNNGVYYLVRPTGCGSWQTVLSAQPGRDAALP